MKILKTKLREKCTKCTRRKKRSSGYFARYDHDCALMSENPIENTLPGTTCWVTMRRFWYRLVCVSERRPCVLRILRSQYAVAKEQQRQITNYKYSIHPYSDFRLLWEFMISVVCGISLIISPLAYAFKRMEFLVIRILFVVILMSDIVVNCFTGYYSEAKKEVIFKFSSVIWHYVKTFLFLDILSSIDFFSHDTFVNSIIFCAKMFRIFTLWRYTRKIAKVLGVSYGTYAVCFLILLFLILPHFLGCLILYLFRNFKRLDYHGSKRYDNLTISHMYVDVYYHGAIMMNLAGYGNRDPASNHEALAVTICWYACFGISIYFRGVLLEIITCRTSSKHKYMQMVLQLKEYMKYKQMPRHLQRRLMSYYEFRYQRRFFIEREILNAVSGQLRQEIALHSCRKLVENVAFFNQLPTNQLVRIVSCLKSEIFLTNDVIVLADTKSHVMYFISTGTVAVYTASGQEISHLEDGAYFAESCVLFEDRKVNSSVVAVEISELYSLSRDDFIRAIHPYPDLMEEILKIALYRQEVINTLNEQHIMEMQDKKRATAEERAAGRRPSVGATLI